MGTHSIIGYKKDGKITAAFCYSDGGVEHNGMYMLAMFRYSREVFKNLIDIAVSSGDYLGSFGYASTLRNFTLRGQLEMNPHGYSLRAQSGKLEDYFSLIGILNVNIGRGDRQRFNTIEDTAVYGNSYIVDFDEDIIMLINDRAKMPLDFNKVDSLSNKNLFRILRTMVNLDPFIEDYKELIIPRAVDRYCSYLEALQTSDLKNMEVFAPMLLKSVSILNASHHHEEAIAPYLTSVWGLQMPHLQTTTKVEVA